MVAPKCAECSRRITESDLVVAPCGELIHLSCWQRLSSQPLLAESRRRIRASRERLARAPAFENARDSNGRPICPACAKSIGPTEAAVRQERSLVHLHCWKGRQPPSLTSFG